MPEPNCPQGHPSTESDFCSICGVKMQPAPAAQMCPDCGLARDAEGGIFCEFCGYNFNTREHGELKPGAAVFVQQPAVPARVWQVMVAVDPSLRSEESPEAPAGVAPLAVSLSRESNLIGRRSDKRGIFPEIALDSDVAVSHRHALLNRLPDGGLAVRDIGSSNGTSLNGVPLTPLTDVALKEGDELTLGHWTRITIQ